MSDVYIKQLKWDDWQDYKSIRLHALKEHPGVYFADYDETVKLPDSFWQEPLDSDHAVVFGIYDGDNMIGLAGVFTWREDPTGKTAIFAMDFIHRDYRGKGLTKLLYQARLEWVRARTAQFDKAAIGHRAGNEASRRAIISHDFKLVGKEICQWPDGTEDLEYNYELWL